MKKVKKIKLKFKKHLPIGQTLETKDKYLPIDKKHSKILKSSRPVIIVAKQLNENGDEEYAVVPTSTRNTRNTREFNKSGIKYVRNNLEIEDNQKRPIMQNEKFILSKRTTRIPIETAENLLNSTLNHTKFSSQNRKKYNEFKNRYKKKKR